MILIESGVRFARPFVTPFNAINETAIRSPCGGKAESSGCLQIKSLPRPVVGPVAQAQVIPGLIQEMNPPVDLQGASRTQSA